MCSTPGACANSNRFSPAELSRFIWSAKYRRADEAGIGETWWRVARTLAAGEADSDGWAARFEAALEDFRFLPGGRVLAGAGRSGASLFNCFVLPGPAATAAASQTVLAETVRTLEGGGGVGCDFSAVPPRNWPEGVSEAAGGPVFWLHAWDDACRTALARSARKGAMMGVLRCDHPDVEAFASAKLKPGVLSRFNLSVAVTDAFMAAVRADGLTPLWFRAGSRSAIVAVARARALWETILRCAYESGEPGVLFIDRINASNNLWWQETIAATNPCGETPLPDYGACCLGSLNLTRFVRNPFTRDAALDYRALAKVTAVAVRMLDNVIDCSGFPLPQQARVVRQTRRLGLGITGLADGLLMLGRDYAAGRSIRVARRVMRTVRDAAYRASVQIAVEKGAFPSFDRARFLDSEFVGRLPVDLRQAISAHGIRNSHLLAIAPTGSVSLLAGGVSSGLEPIFAADQRRSIAQPDGSERQICYLDATVAAWRDAGGRGDPPGLRTAQELPITAHLAMQAALQPFVDNAISKTINVASSISFDVFKGAYEAAYDSGLKGCTVFRDRAGAVLVSAETCAQARS